MKNHTETLSPIPVLRTNFYGIMKFFSTKLFKNVSGYAFFPINFRDTGIISSIKCSLKQIKALFMIFKLYE